MKQPAAVKSVLHRVRRITAHLLLLLVLLGRLMHVSLRLGSLGATILHQLLALSVVLFGHHDNCLPPGVALLQFLKGLGHLVKCKLGLHNGQDL